MKIKKWFDFFYFFNILLPILVIHYPMIHPVQHIDIFENFILHNGLTWSEHLIYNYGLRYGTKEDAIGYTRIFFTNSPTRDAYDRVVKKFKLLEESIVEGKIILTQTNVFQRNIVKKQAKDWKGRPRKYTYDEWWNELILKRDFDEKWNEKKKSLENELIRIESELRKNEGIRRNAIRKSLENPDDTNIYNEILKENALVMQILEMKKKEIFSELSKYKSKEVIFDNLQDSFISISGKELKK